VTFVLRKICITNSKSVLVSLENPKQTKKKEYEYCNPFILCLWPKKLSCARVDFTCRSIMGWILRGENRLKTGYLSQRVVK